MPTEPISTQPVVSSPHASMSEAKADSIDLSLIVPCYNEERNIRPFFEAACAAFDETGIVFEAVFIDDGSSDNTMSVLRELVEEQQGAHHVQVIGFSRNFGKESALYAGMQSARGNAIAFIDADLQQDPELARTMYEYLVDHDEYDVIAACQVDRREGFMLKLFKRAFYRTFNGVSDDIDIPADVSDFRVFRRDVASALLSMPECSRFSKGLFAWVGFSAYSMPYTPNERYAGTSKWSFTKLFKYAMGGILSFTTWPLKIAIWVGGIASVGAVLYLLWVLVVDYLINGISVPGYPTLVCLILLFGGFQLCVLGIIGEYLARTYIEGKRRPIYVARERLSSE